MNWPPARANPGTLDTAFLREVKPDARRIRGLLKSPHAIAPTVEQMDETVSKHLREKHAPARNGRKSAGR